MAVLKILVADDHPVVREGLKRIIDQTHGMTVVAEAEDGPAALEKVRAGNIDAVILDIGMPGRDGLDVLKQMKAHHPRLPVLMLSQSPEEEYAVRALRAGASGYLTKGKALLEVAEALRQVAAGRKYITAELAETLALELDGNDKRPPHEQLSDREHEILLKLGAGLSVSEIARELSLSVKTVSTYRTRLLQKMKMTRNSELIRYVVENRL